MVIFLVQKVHSISVFDAIQEIIKSGRRLSVYVVRILALTCHLNGRIMRQNGLVG
jgi:hypothetical protein